MPYKLYVDQDSHHPTIHYCCVLLSWKVFFSTLIDVLALNHGELFEELNLLRYRLPKTDCRTWVEPWLTPKNCGRFLLSNFMLWYGLTLLNSVDVCVCVSHTPLYHIPLYVCPTKVAGGTDIIKQSLRTFVPTSMATVMVVDLISYDGFPAMAALEVAWLLFNHTVDSNHFVFMKLFYNIIKKESNDDLLSVYQLCDVQTEAYSEACKTTCLRYSNWSGPLSSPFSWW